MLHDLASLWGLWLILVLVFLAAIGMVLLPLVAEKKRVAELELPRGDTCEIFWRAFQLMSNSYLRDPLLKKLCSLLGGGAGFFFAILVVSLIGLLRQT